MTTTVINIPENITTLDAAALHCALIWHKDHKRRYTGEDYSIHLLEVAGMCILIPEYPGVSRDVVFATALLHDVIEDIKVTVKTMRVTFARFDKEKVEKMISGIRTLSDLEGENRAQKFAHAVVKLARAEDWLQDIKRCDSISNTKSILVHDPKFLKACYLPEKRILLDAMTKGSQYLKLMARNTIIRAEESLVQLKLKEMEGNQ